MIMNIINILFCTISRIDTFVFTNCKYFLGENKPLYKFRETIYYNICLELQALGSKYWWLYPYNF